MEFIKEWYSNCFLEAVKAKIKYKKEIDIIFIPAKKNDVNCPHVMWKDKRDNTICDFYCDKYLEHWWNFFWWKGHIRKRPYDIFERWWATR